MPTPLSLYVADPEAIPMTGERMTYLVRSRTNPALQYRCDLTANDGAGHCQCVDFGTRRQPNIDAGMLSLTRATRCRHLELAHTSLLRDLLSRIAKDERE